MKKFKILITDNISEEGIAVLENSGDIEIEIKAGINDNELRTIIGNYDAIITRSGTRISKETIENPGSLRIIGRAGVGLDNIDIEEASRKNIIVMNAPTGNTVAATELTMGLILSAARKLPAANNSTKSLIWDRKKFLGVQLYEKTLGIIGLGRIGGNVALRAKAFGMAVIAYDPYIKKAKAESLGVSLVDNLETLLKESDVVTIHTPLTAETYRMITKDKLEIMKKDSILINCARGGIIDEDALYEAIINKKLFSAGLDVFENEPPINNKLFQLENVFVTPHIGANTFEGQKGVAVIIAEQIVSALHNKSYINAVNIPFIKSLLSKIHQIYFDLAEKIGKLAAQVAKGRTQELRMQFIGELFEEDVIEPIFDSPLHYQPFTIACIKGFLEVILKETVTYISAPFLSKDRHIDIYESKSKNYERFNNLILLYIKTDQEEKVIGGTVLSDEIGRVVIFDKFHIDMMPKGTFLYFRNYDRPGVIGRIGTLLGNNNINIAGFELSRVKSGEAVAFVSVDNPLNKSLLQEILKIDGIIEAKVIEF